MSGGVTGGGHLMRRARPEDALEIAYHCYLAGRGQVTTSIYDLMMPGPPGPTPDRLRQIAGMLTAPTRCWFHYSYYSVVECGGRVVASLCTFSKEEGRTRPMLAVLKEAGWTDADLETMGARLRPVIAVEPRVVEGAWVIQNVGCHETFRRRGLTNELLVQAVEEGVARGHELQQVSVFIENEPAINAYLKVGFEITGEKRDPGFARTFGCPGMLRMHLRRPAP